MNLSSRQSRILWEARPDPDAARRLARPYAVCGWIVLVSSVFMFAAWLVFGRGDNAPPFSAVLAERSYLIKEIRVDTHELRGLAIPATLLLLLSASFFLAPTIAAAVARHRRASFGALPSPAGKRFVLVRDDLPDGTCRALLVFPEPVPSGRRPKPVLHIRGPFRSEDADRGEDILRRELGLPPRDAAEATPMPAPHEFPPWMIPDERTRLAAKIAPGERLLWVGKPVVRVSPFVWLALPMGAFLAYTAYMALSKLPGSGVSSVIRESVPAWARQLFSGEFGATGVVFGVAWAVVIIGSVIVHSAVFVWWLLLPWFSRRAERRRRFIVTNRRAWTIPNVAKIRAFAPEVFPPTIRHAGYGRSDMLFLPIGNSVYDAARASRWKFLGFTNLPDADIPAALAALEELRRSATPSSAEEPRAENA